MIQARLTFEITGDGMAALLAVSPGEPIGAEELARSVAAAGIAFGVDAETMERLASSLARSDFSCSGQIVALGERPSPGRDGSFEVLFSSGLQPGAFREDGTMDFQERDLLKPVSEGELIARLHAPVPGRAGTRVDGAPIAVDEVTDVKVALGPGVRIEDDGGIHAVRPGVVLLTAGPGIDVVDHHVHQGDVDMRSGHLEMEGSLVVEGNVTSGFAARASGDVEVRGSVEGGTIQAGGSATIRQVTLGGEGGAVEADGDLSIARAERAALTCGGLLRIEDALSCTLRAGRIQVTKHLRGGGATAELSIVAEEVGAPQSGVETRLVAGEPLHRQLSSARQALDAAKARRADTRRGGPSRPTERGKGGKLARADAARSRQEVLELSQLALRRGELERIASIEVAGVLHAGARVRIGREAIVVEEPQRGVRFHLDPETQGLRMDHLRTEKGSS